ncbi:hypothetical protein HK099_001793, partial [Clydaea vesicula]
MKKKNTECIFCLKDDFSLNKVKQDQILLRDDEFSVFFDINPASEYHLLVIPNVHM